jgi:hypothetical protein
MSLGSFYLISGKSFYSRFLLLFRYRKQNKEFILDSCIKYIKRRRQENAMKLKLERNKLGIDFLLKKMDAKLQVKNL